MRADRKGGRLATTLVAMAVLSGLLSAPRPARAQSANPGDSGAGALQPGGSRHAGAHGGRHTQAATSSPRLIELKPQVDPWPRLDAGATICRSLPDLQQLARLQRNRDQAASEHPSCRIVTAMMPISILSRVGPGATEVRIAGTQSGTAWTNAWLPDRPAVSAQPPSGTRR